MRIGQGIDVHPLRLGRPLVLAGVTIAHDRGPDGDSDGDPLSHAAIDAILGAAHLGDMGCWFTATDPAVRGARSLDLLKIAWNQVRALGFRLENLDATVVVQSPRLAPYREAMEDSLAKVLETGRPSISVKAKSTDHLGFLGREEGILATVVVLLEST